MLNSAAYFKRPAVLGVCPEIHSIRVYAGASSSMIVLDENILESQRQLLLGWHMSARQIGHDVGRKGMKDRDMGHTMSVSSMGISVWRPQAGREVFFSWVD